jgi:uncharacterized membrane protein (UPF0127 family)
MRVLRVVNTRQGRELGSRIKLADGWLSRLRGMLARPAPLPGEGMLLSPCRSVHMFGMRFPLDVAFLDAEGGVLASYPALRPGARTPWHRRAAHALELPAGTLENSGTQVGDILVWTPESLPAAGSARTEAVL